MNLPAFDRLLLAAAGLCGAAIPAPAQAIRLRAPVAHPRSILGITVISVSATPASLSFALNSGAIANASGPVTITTTLTNPLLTTVNLYGFFTASDRALSGNTSAAHIPSSAVYGLVPNGLPTTWTPFTQTGALGGPAAGLELSSVSGVVVSTTATYALSLRIDLSSLPQLPADTYTGTLYLQAQVF